jgi:hypothetical protein
MPRRPGLLRTLRDPIRARQLLRQLLARRGYAVANLSQLDLEPDFVEIYGRCAAYTMTTIERMYALYKAIEYVVENDIPGDIVECGVWRGGSSMLAAITLERLEASSHLVKGKVEDTIPHGAPEQIALLRLDTDWYESTYHELCHLFPRVSKSGVLILDDYGRWEGSRRAVDRYLDETGESILLNRIDHSGRVGVRTGHS